MKLSDNSVQVLRAGAEAQSEPAEITPETQSDYVIFWESVSKVAEKSRQQAEAWRESHKALTHLRTELHAALGISPRQRLGDLELVARVHSLLHMASVPGEVD